MHDRVQDICWNITCPENWVPSYKQNDGIQLWDPRKLMQAIKPPNSKKIAIETDCIYISGVNGII
jgi:hypothetical protein